MRRGLGIAAGLAIAVAGVVPIPANTASALTAAAQPTQAQSAKKVRPGKVRVRVSAPKGVAVNVTLRNAKHTRVVAKSGGVASKSAAVSLPRGKYRVLAPDTLVAGVAYRARTSKKAVRLGTRTGVVRVRYRKLPGLVRNVHTTGITQNSIALTWDQPPRSTTIVRRVSGDTPVSSAKRGQPVRVTKATLNDTGLAPGQQYSYTLFTKRRGDLIGSISLTTGTTSADSLAASFVASSTTRILTSTDIASAAPTGNGVRLTMASGPAPLLGAAVVLPRSDALPGGFLGVVIAISADGATVDLAAASLSDAFDYWDLTSTAVATAAVDLDPLPGEVLVQRQGKRGKSRTQSLASCLGGSASQKVAYDPSIRLGGKFNGHLDKFQVLGKTLVKGAALDVSLSATAVGAASIETTAALNCGLPFVPVMLPLAQTPVPVSFYFKPTAEVSVNGALKIENVGLTATAGVWARGSLSLTSPPSFEAGPIFSAEPLQPRVFSSGTVGITLGGEVVVGPGAGTPGAGVIAGIGGRLNILEAGVGAVFPVGDQRFNGCLKAEAKWTRELNLTAKAWLGNWDVSKSVTLDALKGETGYAGSPWYFPGNCEKQPESVAFEPLTFDEYWDLGQDAEVSDLYADKGIRFEDAPYPILSRDTANPTWPVLAGQPRFRGPITFFLEKAGKAAVTDRVSFDVGYLDDIGTVRVTWFGLDGSVIGSQLTTETGIEHVVVNAPGIHRLTIEIDSVEAAGFAIDNLGLGSGAQEMPEAKAHPGRVSDDGTYSTSIGR